MVVSCRECNGKVSTEAATCPHCGAPSPNENWTSLNEMSPAPSLAALSDKTDIVPRTPAAPAITPQPAPASVPLRTGLGYGPIIRSRKHQHYKVGTSKPPLAPLFILVVAPIVFSIGVVIALQTALLRFLGLNALAIFGLVWAGFCVAELFAVPMVARARGKDPGIWFVVTVIWLFFDTFLAALAHIAGWVTLAAVMSAIDRRISPAMLLTGIVGVVVSAFIVYLPLWVLLLSSPANSGDAASRSIWANRISNVRTRLRNPFRKGRLKGK